VRSVMAGFCVLAATLVATSAGWMPLAAAALVMLLGTLLFDRLSAR
jgi:aerotaxis receptor